MQGELFPYFFQRVTSPFNLMAGRSITGLTKRKEPVPTLESLVVVASRIVHERHGGYLCEAKASAYGARREGSPTSTL